MFVNWFLVFINVTLINLILSGDNTIAISLSANKLPRDLRKHAITWGSVIAIVLLMVFLVVGTFLIHLPVVKTAAGALLLWIAIHLVMEHMHHDPTATDDNASSGTDRLWKAIRMIAVADLVMSLDNAVAMLGIANGRVSVLAASLLVTIPFLIFGSHLIAKLLERFSWVVYLASTYIAYLAGQMIAEDRLFTGFSWDTALRWVAPVASLAVYGGVILIAALRRRSRKRVQGETTTLVADESNVGLGQ